MSLQTCATCGTAFRPDATPNGLCPTCLLARGVDSEAGRPPATGATRGHAPPPAIEDLAKHFPQLELLEIQGRGGMGAVYRARQKELGRTVALKILPSDVGEDPDFAERFRREACALAALSHAGIVHLYDFGQSGEWWWFVMEYVDGATLRGLLADGPVEPSLALSIVRQVCDALEYAHGQGVVHRDIKPENILVDRAGRVKIVDFGLARLVGGDARDLTLTYTGQRMGTPHYMAPEQWENPSGVDHRADIYALGVVFYELLTSELPVGRFGPPSDKSDVSPQVDHIVLKALERDRERRYQRTADMSTDVQSSSAAPHAEPRGKARPAPTAASATAKPAASDLLPEARGWSAWVAKSFWLVGGGMVLAGIAAGWLTSVAMDALDTVGPRGELAMLDVDEAMAASLAFVVVGAIIAFLARRRAHSLDRAAAAPAVGRLRPWMQRRYVLPLMGVTGIVLTAIATENMPDGALLGALEFGVLILLVAGMGLATRMLWWVLPKRVPRKIPAVVTSLFATAIGLGLGAERHHELKFDLIHTARLTTPSGLPAWTQPSVDGVIINSMTDQNFAHIQPIDTWVSASFSPRRRVARSQSGRVSWDVRIEEPAGVRDNTFLVYLARVTPASRSSAIVEERGLVVGAIEMGDGEGVHRELVSLDMSALAAAHPDDAYATWDARLEVHLCRVPSHVAVPMTYQGWSTLGRRVGGMRWSYDAEPFTTVISDTYASDFPAPVSAELDFEPSGVRVIRRTLLAEETSSAGDVQRWTFEAQLHLGHALDASVPLALEHDIWPTQEWIEADEDDFGELIERPFGGGELVVMPGTLPVVASVGGVAESFDGGAELVGALATSIDFEVASGDWRGRFADDVFQKRVAAVRLVARPSRSVALAAPYNIQEYWTGEAIDVVIPLVD